jgi:glycosyltransferase involved in cell wall biosynthesis
MLTLRGKEERQMRMPVSKPLRAAIRAADGIIAVSAALKDVAVAAGAKVSDVEVIGNGIDLEKIYTSNRTGARRQLGLAEDAEVIVSVGTLVERKGFHRVIACLPTLVRSFPKLCYLVVGGAGPEGDISDRLRSLAADLGVSEHVRFLGALPPAELNVPLSAADVFVLASSYEGWANVLLEAMACGLPVVATDVGGNAEVVANPELGTIVPFGDANQLLVAIDGALRRSWDRAAIRRYAENNSWDARMAPLLAAFDRLHEASRLRCAS